MLELSEGTKTRIAKLFPPEHRAMVEIVLREECGNNLPFCEDCDMYQMERTRFAALKVSGGDMDKLLDAVALAQRDSRDLLMAAGFGHDVHAHERWLA